ncbi:MAG: hypothetical protein RL500_1376 [Pseudomonadota bacterium]
MKSVYRACVIAAWLVPTLAVAQGGASAQAAQDPPAPQVEQPATPAVAPQQPTAPSPAASAPGKEAASEASKPARPTVTVTVGGQKTRITESPVWFEWTGSEAMTKLGGHAMRERGVQAATSSGQAALKVTVSGELTLMGGPKFYRGARAPLAAVFENAAKLDKSRSFDELDAKRLAVDSAVAGAISQSGVSVALKALAIGDVAVSLLQSTGLIGWLNAKTVGDPRGVCISRCETWNVVTQTAYVRVQIQRGDQAPDEVRIMARAAAEALVIDEVVQRAVAAVWDLFPAPVGAPASSPTPPSGG